MDGLHCPGCTEATRASRRSSSAHTSRATSTKRAAAPPFGAPRQCWEFLAQAATCTSRAQADYTPRTPFTSSTSLYAFYTSPTSSCRLRASADGLHTHTRREPLKQKTPPKKNGGGGAGAHDGHCSWCCISDDPVCPTRRDHGCHTIRPTSTSSSWRGEGS